MKTTESWATHAFGDRRHIVRWAEDVLLERAWREVSADLTSRADGIVAS